MKPASQLRAADLRAGRPLVLRAGGDVERVEATGLPIGMFCSERFESTTLQLARGETMFFYTDGVTEAQDAAGVEYGIDRLCTFITSAAALAPTPLIERCARDLAAFASKPARADDVTMMAVRRSPGEAQLSS